MRRRPPALAILASVLSLTLLAVAACSDSSTKRFIPRPPSTVALLTTAPPGSDHTGISLAPVEGRTPPETVQITGGTATLGGLVTGPDGPVSGATVRLERFVEDASAKLDITTNADGTWKAPQTGPPPTIATIPTLPLVPGQVSIPPLTTFAPPPAPTTTSVGPQGILGGRYRVRAWRTPDLALTTPQILFLDAKQNQTLVLQLSRYQGVSASSITSPDTPVLNGIVNLTVVVMTVSVNGEGVVSSAPLPNAAVSLSVTGSSLIFSGGPSITNVQGRATFQLRCLALGQSSVELTVNNSQTFALPVKPCAAPPSTTTSSLPDGGFGSTSSSILGGSTTTVGTRPSAP